jgi:SAM-dependent methyltransferase
MNLAGNIPTDNRRGWSSLVPDEYSSQFADFAKCCVAPVLDIGAGFGCATVAALDAGATVIANDIDDRQLQALAQKISCSRRPQLSLLSGRFPELVLDAKSLGAINAARVLHFLTGAEIEKGVIDMYDWLLPGGKVFALAQTPWIGNMLECLPIYESRKGKQRWPGEIYDTHCLLRHPTAIHLPDFIHSLDQDVLREAFTSAGFVIEKLEVFRRRDCPPAIYLDGRENVGLIARKP